MTITYVQKKLGTETTFTIPVLHKVVYGMRERFNANGPWFTNRHHNQPEIDAWLKVNCKNPYYTSPGWTDEYFIQFEDDEEAMMFALRWSQ